MVNSSSKNISSSSNATAQISSNSTDSSAVELEPDIRNQYPNQISQLVNQTNQFNVARRNLFRNNFSTNSTLIISLITLLLFATPSNALPSPTSPNILAALAETATAACCACAQSEGDRKKTALFAVEAAMIPILVLVSGVVAGLTLGYMSLDTTQLTVLAKTGTPKQQYYAKRVLPIRKDGHLLLITLLLANMIVNETLPVLADGVLGGGVQAVVISTVLIVIFAEIIPQSVCSRFGLAIGSAMVYPVRVLIYTFYIVAWPVSRILAYFLGDHSGVVYRRAELKELVNLHSMMGGRGDLDQDTVTIVGATLDLQTKVVSDAMTPIQKVFQLPITSKLDYETLGRVLKAGHSRIPVYEEVAVGDKIKKRIVGVLLTKQLILLDPEDAVPLRDIPMNTLPIVPEDLPLLQILNTFQEGRSHMAIVCRRKPGFNPVIKRSTKSFASGSAESKVDFESNMEKGEVTGERSILKGLFSKHGKNDDDDDSKTERNDPMTLKQAWASGTSAGASKSSLHAIHLDEDYPIGLITLEDVLEELIGEEIYDESDSIDGLQQPTLKYFLDEESIARIGGPGPPPAPSALIASKPTPAPSKPSGIVNAVGRLSSMVRSKSTPGKARTKSDGAMIAAEILASASAPVSGDITPAPTPPTSPPPAENTETGSNNIEVLALIAESNSDGGGSTTEGEGEGDTLTERRLLTSDNIATPLIPIPYLRPAPPALADAVLLERGRRLLVHQGIDPAALPALRLAAPRSQPASRSSTPSGSGAVNASIVVPPPVASASGLGKKGSFKSPPLLAPTPIRVVSNSSPFGPVVTTSPLITSSTINIEAEVEEAEDEKKRKEEEEKKKSEGK